MQQRLSIGSTRAPDENGVGVNSVQQPQTAKFSPRNSTDDMDSLPIYDPHSSIGKKEISRLRLREKWVHVIPVIVFLCLFTLWWFSYPVKLVTKEGKVIDIHRVEKPLPLDNSRLHFAILGSATPPFSIGSDHFAGTNLTEKKQEVKA